MKNLFSIIFILLTSVCNAQTDYINYQGIARNAEGNPLTDQILYIRASIGSDSLGGISEYTELHKPKTTPLGQFSLKLGKGSVQKGVYKNITWTTGNKYLKIEMSVDGKNYILSGISQFNSVPYASYAMKAANVKSYTGKSPVSVAQNFTIGLNAATNPGDLMTWDGINWIAKSPVPQNFELNNMQPFLVTNYYISLYGIFPQQNGGDPYVGEIMLFAGNYEPMGYALCNGQLLSIAENETLFNIIGTTYGGDGLNTFAVPDLRGRAPIHQGKGPGLSTFIIGSSAGSETIKK